MRNVRRMATRPDISSAAGKAKQIRVKDETITRHDLSELIEADEHITGQNAVKKKKTLFNKIKFGGMGGTE